MKIPLRDGTEFDLAPFIDGFKAKYPHIDMPSELAKLHLWLHRNPASRPTMPFRFVENWLKKIQPKSVKLHLVNGKMSESEMLALGVKLGTNPRPGEGWEQFARRLRNLQDKSA